MGFPLLSLITWLPMAGVLFILTVRGDEKTVAANARWAALWTSLIVFGLSLLIWVKFDRTTANFQFVEDVQWLPQYKVAYKMGVDGISVLFVLLSTALTPICILASWESVQTKVREFMISFLVLETMMVGMFCALDFVVFYMFFEAVLIPMYLIIGVWGGPRRVYAAGFSGGARMACRLGLAGELVAGVIACGGGTDPANTGAFVTRIPLPAAPKDVTIANGMALVAAGVLDDWL